MGSDPGDLQPGRLPPHDSPSLSRSCVVCFPILMLSLAVLFSSGAWRGAAPALAAPEPAPPRGRARDLGIVPGVLTPGRWNAITDVEGVLVGHTTIIDGDDFRTGVTAVLPHSGNLFKEKVPAAVYVGNGFGKLTGISQVQELGTLETPILLTGTLSVPRVADALITYMLGLPGNERVRSVNPVVGETNDGFLSDIRSRPIRPEHVFHALRGASSGPVEEGSVGAGTGTVAFGFKGGIGTSSRRLPDALGGWTIGVLVQTNYGGVLTIAGAPVGRELDRYYLRDLLKGREAPAEPSDNADGSCMIVVATDAPLTHRNLERLAKRAMLGLARTGSPSTNGSGDYVIAFSTNPALRVRSEARAAAPASTEGMVTSAVRNDQISPLFLAVVEATEEAIYNSLFAATEMIGWQGHRVEALPIDRVLEILARHGVIE
ncbi:MAG: P1 family peptidase [Acidobacteriota bacterium]